MLGDDVLEVILLWLWSGNGSSLSPPSTGRNADWRLTEGTGYGGGVEVLGAKVTRTGDIGMLVAGIVTGPSNGVNGGSDERVSIQLSWYASK